MDGLYWISPTFWYRYDLAPLPSAKGAANWTARAFGAVDGKVLDSHLFLERSALVINGPTADDQEAFSWSSFAYSRNISHQGTVESYNFDWQHYRASLPWRGLG